MSADRRERRRLLVATLQRWARYEFWPTWLLYLPIVPTWVACTIRTRHPLAFTACNPGIAKGGGFIGESKAEIYARMAVTAELDPIRNPRSPVCPTFVIRRDDAPDGRGPDRRAAAFAGLLAEHDGVLRLPVVVKPDSAFRGFGFRVVRSTEEAERYFRSMRADAVVQPFHPGPHEVGVLWTRRTKDAKGLSGGRSGPESAKGRPAGEIFSITLKEAPFVEGDGVSSLRELILKHPRRRLQARTFFARHRDRLDVVPDSGERVLLAHAGNHCQGALFRDGSHLITPELTAAIDRVCRLYGATVGASEAEGSAAVDSGLLDFVRLDIRCRSLDELAAGRLDAWAIVELNGTGAESTNIYDPERTLGWALGRLRAQWRVLYALGGARMRAGHRPLSVRGILAETARYYRGRSGSALSD